ncbi:MAG: serine/threonine-protein kinase [Myxococcota bacterium]
MAQAQGFPVPFGKYLLTELIAVGGMAEIYRAKIFGVDGFEKQMVVKRILPKYAQNPSFVQMFIDEAKIVVALTHGNIVPVYELGEVAGNYYIAMEYAEGMTALELLRECFTKQRPLSIPQALYVAAEVAKGLGYAHTRSNAQGQAMGIVHRDLNPRNIVVSPAGEVKILDFGIARSAVKKHQTGSGVIKGTPGYMAPEQLMGLSVDARADQYGLAIILHELLTVRRLFSVRDAVGQRALLENGKVFPPSTYRPEIGPQLDKVVMRALSMRPEDRFPSCLDFEDALRGEVARLGAHVTSRQLASTIQEIKSASPAVAGAEMTARSVVASGSTPPPSDPRKSSPPAVPAQAPPPPPANTGADLTVDSGFRMSEKPLPRLPSLPSLPVAVSPSEHRPVTQVLVANDQVDWANKIGADAELLALAKASGINSKTPRRTLLAATALVLVAVGAWGATHPEEVAKMLTRARTGKTAQVGSLVVKSRPAGGVVILDGEETGRTNLKIDNVDTEQPHTLKVRLVDGREFERQIAAGDFGQSKTLEVMFDPAADEKKEDPKATPTP